MSLPPSWRTSGLHPGAGAPVARSTASTSRVLREASPTALRTVAASIGLPRGPAASTGAASNEFPEEEVPQPDKAVASPRIKPHRQKPVIAHPPTWFSRDIPRRALAGSPPSSAGEAEATRSGG